MLRFFFFSLCSFSPPELFSYTNPSLYPLIFNASSYSILELSVISFENEMVEIRLPVVLSSSFNTCCGWLEPCVHILGHYLVFDIVWNYHVQDWIKYLSTKITTNRLVLMVMASPYFLNVSMSFFLFLSKFTTWYLFYYWQSIIAI